MLRKLYIKNYALIDTLDIDFGRGLNMITGETGAGKSIIMGALGLILGNRVEGKPFFDESAKCVIEGYFDIASYALRSFFEDQDLDYEEPTIVRREISPEGKSRAFVNDSPVTLQVLKALGERLIDIHSQHATQQVNTEAFQFLVLDSVAGNHELLTEYNRKLKSYKQAKIRLQELEENIAQANMELDYNQFVFTELESAQLIEGELEELEKEQQQLENAEEIKRSLLSAQYHLEESEYNVLSGLKESLADLQRVSGYLPEGEELLSRLNSSLIELKDVSAELGQRGESVVMDEERLHYVTERISTLYNLIQKYRVAHVNELISLRDSVEEKIRSVGNQEEKLIQLREELDQLEKQTKDVASQISSNRKSVLSIITQSVEEILTKVGMPHAVLQVGLQTVDQFTAFGTDKVEFLFSANKGQSPQPIHKVASGGELSRVMLAIKSLVARSSALPTIVFDEIDTGISGEVALQVGEVMESLAGHMQVIAITHLPQIASKGERHFKVFKEDTALRTLSRIEVLDTEQRVLEVAKMLSGATPGEAALQHARDLIGD